MDFFYYAEISHKGTRIAVVEHALLWLQSLTAPI